jgi:hypothetical protein
MPKLMMTLSLVKKTTSTFREFLMEFSIARSSSGRMPKLMMTLSLVRKTTSTPWGFSLAGTGLRWLEFAELIVQNAIVLKILP